VDALSDGTAVGGTYGLRSFSDELPESSLLYKEFAGQIDAVLARRGLRKVTSGAELAIEVTATMSEPLAETRQTSEPIYIDRPSYTRIVSVPVVNNKGQVVGYKSHRLWEPSSFHLAGWNRQNVQVTVYDKLLKLRAFDTANGSERWVVTAVLRDGSTDYRATFPLLLMAAEDFIGGRTEGEVIVEVLPPEAD
jgi:hypothetical protein